MRMVLASDTGSLVYATWGLVVATTLLVIAAIIPVVVSVRERWLTLAEQAALVVPPLHILASRVEGLADEIVQPSCEFRPARKDVSEQLEMLEEILVDAPKLGIRFVSDLFIARHLLTHARYSCALCEKEAEHQQAGGSDYFDGLVSSAGAQLLGALTSLREAERRVPRRKIDGEDFWSRFTRLSAARTNNAPRLWE